MWAIDRRTGWFVVFSACIGACAFFAILWITAGGIGVSPDSTIYIDTARNLLAGNGFVARGAPMTHFPPLYPILLAVSGSFGSDILESARYLNALLFAANVILCSVAVWLATERSLCAAALTGLWVMVSYGIVQPHAMVWSEPPFMVFVLIALVALTVFIGKQRGHWLYLASVAIGLAMLTRYVGAAFVPVLFVVPLLLASGRFFYRVRSGAIAAFIACVPLCVWLLYNISRAGTATNRVLAFHPPGVPFARSVIAHTSYLLFPVWEIPLLAKAFLFTVALSGAVSIVLWLRKRGGPSVGPREPDTALLLAAVLFLAAYFAFLVVSISLFDDGTWREGSRFFPPGLLFLLLASITLVWSTRAKTKRTLVWWLFVLFAGVSISVNARRDLIFGADAHRNGLGFNSIAWRNSETLAAIRALPTGIRVFSNGAVAVQFLTGRATYEIPARTSYGGLVRRTDFERRLRAMCDEVQNNRAVVVYFTAYKTDWMPTPAELGSICEVSILGTLPDGVIYGKSTSAE
ncbi:MAG TPA: glycosyltransferase family 39 protein [Candidatus Latescibacteria bacterium]|nr:glycosyltransferase family 39 protein [Candidatus Latescibacterota bacterium]